MKELETSPAVKITGAGRATEGMAIAGLTNLINMGDIREGDDGPSLFAPPDPIPTGQQQAAMPAARRQAPVPVQRPAAAPLRVKELSERIFTTGRLKRGKDYVLERFGFQKAGFADPLYALQEFLFGTRDKSAPGARKFLQTAGQWGRGLVNEQYPLTPTRALFCMMITTLGVAKRLPDDSVNWHEFGNDRLWVDALLRRVAGMEGRVAVSNVRFENEYKALSEAGWEHWHVMCSQQTWEKRLKASGMVPNSPLLTDTSEQLAITMDKDTLAHIKLKPTGPKLRVIWNDDEVRCPSPRLYTLAELQ
jgi:hypothetical protein